MECFQICVFKIFFHSMNLFSKAFTFSFDKISPLPWWDRLFVWLLVCIYVSNYLLECLSILSLYAIHVLSITHIFYSSHPIKKFSTFVILVFFSWYFVLNFGNFAIAIRKAGKPLGGINNSHGYFPSLFEVF